MSYMQKRSELRVVVEYYLKARQILVCINAYCNCKETYPIIYYYSFYDCLYFIMWAAGIL